MMRTTIIVNGWYTYRKLKQIIICSYLPRYTIFSRLLAIYSNIFFFRINLGICFDENLKKKKCKSYRTYKTVW